MVVHDFHVQLILALPAEANAPLVIDTDAVLPVPVALQRFKPISRRSALRIICGHHNVARYTWQLVVACQCASSRETAGSGMTFFPDLDGFTLNHFTASAFVAKPL